MLLSEAEIMFSEADIEPILGYFAHDKKNKGDKTQFVLLESLGKPIWGVEIPEDTLRVSLEYTIINKVSKR